MSNENLIEQAKAVLPTMAGEAKANMEKSVKILADLIELQGGFDHILSYFTEEERCRFS